MATLTPEQQAYIERLKHEYAIERAKLATSSVPSHTHPVPSAPGAGYYTPVHTYATSTYWANKPHPLFLGTFYNGKLSISAFGNADALSVDVYIAADNHSAHPFHWHDNNTGDWNTANTTAAILRGIDHYFLAHPDVYAVIGAVHGLSSSTT